MKALLLILLILPASAWALSIVPSVKTFKMNGKAVSHKFIVKNDSKKISNINLKMDLRVIEDDNKESTVSSKNFKLVPTSLILLPGKKRTIQVSYIGTDVSAEVAYRLIATENLKQDGISYQAETQASIYVRPKISRSQLKVLSSKIFNGKIFFKLKNRGSKHTVLNNYYLKIKQGKNVFTYDLNAKKYILAGKRNLLAGNLQKFTIKSPKKFSNGDIQAIFIKR